MKNVIVIGSKDDPHIDAVATHIDSHVPFFRITIEDMISQGYAMQMNKNGILQFLMGDLCLQQNTSTESVIWLRKPNRFYYHSPSNEPYENDYLLSETQAFLENLYLVFSESTWLNPYQAMKLADRRIYQLQLAKNLGFNVPDFLITNIPGMANEFYEAQSQGTVIKRIGNQRIALPNGMSIFTSFISQDDLTAPEFTQGLSYLQNLITATTEVRATIVGSRVFAASFERDMSDLSHIDYRDQKITEHFVHELPDSLTTRLLELNSQLQLRYSAVDLLRDDNGEYIFLEINAQGEYLWIEESTGLQISKAIANLLRNL